ncbi:MAG: tetratricopeptide repeat protein [Woeseiaceae bacterium]
MSPKLPEERLDSWKAIARYLGRSVRTVRRWEQVHALPVHRLMHHSKASVYAYPRELDDWREARAHGPVKTSPSNSPAESVGGMHEPSRSTENKGDAAGIAVLPFSFAGPDPSHSWVADGLTEEMISGFSRLAKLRVTSRTSSAAFRNSDRNSKAIAGLLGVTYLLEGGVVCNGRRFRINVRLIDPQQDDHVWSQQFAGDMEQIFDTQEQIVRAVVDSLHLRLAPSEEVTMGQPAVSDISAWRRVVLAREAALRWHPEALEKARSLLTEALELTGENATICATMGRVLLNYHEAGMVTDEDLSVEARSWAKRAHAVDPGHPETRILSGWLAHTTGDLGLAIEELEQALEQDGDHPDALLLLANCLLRTGQTERARPVIDHVIAVDPLTPLTRCMPGFLNAMEGRFDAAIGPYRDMLERDPANPVARLFNVWILFVAGHDDEAITVARGFEGAAEQSTPAHLARQLTAAHRGTLEDRPLANSVTKAAWKSEMYSRHAAEGWAKAGNAKRAAQWLDRAVELGFVNWPYLAQHSPFFSPLKDDPSLKPVLEKAKRRWKAISDSASN